MNRVRGELTAGAYRHSLLVAAVVGLFLGASLAVGAGTVAGSVPDGQFVHGNNSTDSTPPALANGSRAGDTAIAVNFTDNHDVDESTIDVDDFFLSDGNLTGVSVEEVGSNATATLELASGLAVENVTVWIVDNASIADTNGNVIDTEGTVGTGVTGMDSVRPKLFEFSLSDATGGPAEIRLDVTEELAGLNITIDGPETTTLDLSDFREESGFVYTATYLPEEDGEYVFVLHSITDTGGNENPSYIPRQAFADLSPPETVAGIDVAASSGLTFAFDGSRSSDPAGIANYTWTFGDGTSATGRRVTHTFTPGNYTVTLRAADEYGNVGTDTLVLNLSGNADSITDTNLSAESAVSVDRSGGSAIVSVKRASPGSPVRIGGTEPLATGDNVTLDALGVNVTRNASLDLAIEAQEPDATASVGDGRVRPLGVLTVIHGAPDGAIANVTFRFQVAPAALDALDTEPGNVSLYRRQDGGWAELPTAPVTATGRLRAHSPGLSRFAVAATVPAADNSSAEETTSATPTPTRTPEAAATATPTATPTATAANASSPADLTVSQAVLNRTSAPPNGTVVVNLTVENRGNETALFTAGLAINGTTVDKQPVQVPAGGTSRTQFVHRVDPNATGTLPVSVNGTAAGRLTVGGSGGPFGIFGFLPLGVFGIFGFLPLGLLGTVLTYVGGPVMAIYLGLKGLALSLGY